MAVKQFLRIYGTISCTRTRTLLGRCGLHGQTDGEHSPAFRRGAYTAATDGEAMPFFRLSEFLPDEREAYLNRWLIREREQVIQEARQSLHLAYGAKFVMHSDLFTPGFVKRLNDYFLDCNKIRQDRAVSEIKQIIRA